MTLQEAHVWHDGYYWVYRDANGTDHGLSARDEQDALEQAKRLENHVPVPCERCGLNVCVGYTGHVPVRRDGETAHFHSHCLDNLRRQSSPMGAL